MKGAALFSERYGNNDPVPPLRAHVVLVETLAGMLRADMRGGGGLTDHLLMQSPLPGVLPALAWVVMTGEALATHLATADTIFAKSAEDDGATLDAAEWLASASLPDCAWWARHHRSAVAHLAATLDAWCQASEAEARARDHAATEIAAGRAAAHQSADGITVVALPSAWAPAPREGSVA